MHTYQPDKEFGIAGYETRSCRRGADAPHSRGRCRKTSYGDDFFEVGTGRPAIFKFTAPRLFQVVK
jgi:hypothetical protein